MTFSNLKVGARLGLGFGLVLLLLAILTMVGLSRLSSLNDDINATNEERLPKLMTANNWIFRLMETARHTRNMLILEGQDKIKVEVDAVMDDKRARKEYLDQLQKTVTATDEKAMLQAVIETRLAYVPSEDDFLKLVSAGDTAGAKELLLKSMRPAQVAYVVALQKFVEFENNSVIKAGKQSIEDYKSGRTLIISLGILALLLGVAGAWFITVSITRPLAEAVGIAKLISSNDLTGRIDVVTKDETGQLLQALKEMNASLQNIVGQVRAGTESIATGSSQIASGNLDLSSRTEQQASSLEETASSMEELTSTVKQNSDNARQANVLAVSASDVAVKGGEVVAKVVSTMGSINDSAKKIVDIIGVIDSIAFQTNILALNAAVEAARAGEQGRGFAVVASEVRNLAQRSAGAAKEIKTLIGDSVEKIETGSALVNQAGTTMDEIVASVKRVTDIMGEITSAGQEQESGIQQINQAITEMDTVTQQNASLVEEAAAAAEALQDQASSLAQLVSVFKLDGAQVQNIKPTRTSAPVAKAVPKAPVKLATKASSVSRISDAAKTRKATQEPAGMTDDWEQF